MSLLPPNLDDRTFEQLVEDAKKLIPQRCPAWTDLSPADPGITLLELFAFLTETMIYRLNRLPEKAYVEFLRLLGVKLAPPQAAIATLRFSIETAAAKDIEIPRGTRVAVGSAAGEPVVFVTDRAVVVAKDQASVEVTARHCEEIVAEKAGVGTGQPGLRLTVRRPPIISPDSNEGLDLIVGVETTAAEFDERLPSILYEGKRFRIWREVVSFATMRGDTSCYIADRVAGSIQFAPATYSVENGVIASAPSALGAIPPLGREIRVWYRRGGGSLGNAAPGTIDTLKDPIPQVRVSNPTEATGGRDAETMENALTRGPQEIRSLERAVTASDFQDLALRQSGGVARAKAITAAQFWRYAAPGTVELLLVPSLPAEEALSGRFDRARLERAESAAVRDNIENFANERRPLGTQCVVHWARYKTIGVSARVVLYAQENREAVKGRILDRLYRAFSPLPNPINKQGWGFGNAARVFHVFDCAAAEPGVKFVDKVKFSVEELPGAGVQAIACDPFQASTWYAASGEVLYRTLNNGQGWEPSGRFPGETIEQAVANPDRPGFLAVVSRIAAGGYHLWISSDCGETWKDRLQMDTQVRSLAWIIRDDKPELLLATDGGLFLVSVAGDTGPVLVSLDSKAPPAACYAVASGVNDQGQLCVAVALQGLGGVWLSRDGGRDGSFVRIGPDKTDVRTLAMQSAGSRTLLWAGAAGTGGDDGVGCLRYELTGVKPPADGWVLFKSGWTGGSCHAMSFTDSDALAATHSAGVLRLDTRSAKAAWRPVQIGSGLPLRDAGRFQPVLTVGCDLRSGLILAGGAQGVFRSDSGGESYSATSGSQSAEQVTLPDTWLFCSGTHSLEVVTEDEIS